MGAGCDGCDGGVSSLSLTSTEGLDVEVSVAGFAVAGVGFVAGGFADIVPLPACIAGQGTDEDFFFCDCFADVERLD